MSCNISIDVAIGNDYYEESFGSVRNNTCKEVYRLILFFERQKKCK